MCREADSRIYAKYVFYRYVLAVIFLLSYIFLICSIGYFVTPWLRTLPRHLGALIFTIIFEVTYLPIPAVFYFFSKWYGRKIREFYEKYGLGEEWFVKLHDEKMLKQYCAVISTIYVTFGIVWGYYLYTHWPSLCVK